MAQAIQELLHNFVQERNSWQLYLIQNWHHIFGNLSNHVTLEKIQEDTIFIGVYDSCWMQELYLLSPLVLTTINTTLDQPHIKHIRFKRVARKQTLVVPAKKTYKKVQHRALTVQEEKALEIIQDDSLRTALQSFLMRCHHNK